MFSFLIRRVKTKTQAPSLPQPEAPSNDIWRYGSALREDREFPDFNKWLADLKIMSSRAQLTFLFRLIHSLNKPVFEKMCRYVDNRRKKGRVKLNNFSSHVNEDI